MGNLFHTVHNSGFKMETDVSFGVECRWGLFDSFVSFYLPFIPNCGFVLEMKRRAQWFVRDDMLFGLF